VLQAVLYPYGSGDADEAAYVLQARMLLDGHLTLDAGVVEPFFRPWLTGVHDGRVFTKYLPGWPALLAGSQAAFGTMAAAPALVAAGWVAGTYRLARELFDDAATAVAAAVLVACSPLLLVHTALPLAYGAAAASLTLAGAALLRGVRTGARTSLVAGGVGVGFVLLIRPFDAVLGILPCALLAAAVPRRPPRAVLRQAGWSVLGALPFVVILLGYCAHVTGSPLRLPIGASNPLDKFGFGPRSILPSEPTFPFTRTLARQAFIDTLEAAPSWLFGGAVTVGFAVVGLLVRERRAQRMMLAATIAMVFGGYVFWWGSALAIPGLLNGLGPHYHLVAFTPAMILAASGALWLWRWLPAVPGRLVRPARLLPLLQAAAAIAVGCGLVAATAPAIPDKIGIQRYVNDSDEYLASLIPDRLPGPAVVVVTPAAPSRYTQVPYQTLRNSPDLTDRVLYAADLGPAAVGLVDRAPGRTLYRLRPDEIADPTQLFSYQGSFVRLNPVVGPRIELTITVRVPPGWAGRPDAPHAGVGYVRLGGTVRTFPLPGGAGMAVRHTVRILPGPVRSRDDLSVAGVHLPAELVVGFTDGAPGDPRSRWEERFPLGRNGRGDLAVLAPGLGFRRVPARAADGWLPARVTPTLTVSVTTR
jgi:hypothetical protein